MAAEWLETRVFARVLQASAVENASGDATSAETIKKTHASRRQPPSRPYILLSGWRCGSSLRSGFTTFQPRARNMRFAKRIGTHAEIERRRVFLERGAHLRISAEIRTLSVRTCLSQLKYAHLRSKILPAGPPAHTQADRPTAPRPSCPPAARIRPLPGPAAFAKRTG